MSYCRFSEGDVYMIPISHDRIECCGCDICFGTKEEALKHLREHIEKGHDVPQHAIERLEEEIAEEKQLMNEIMEGTEEG